MWLQDMAHMSVELGETGIETCDRKDRYRSLPPLRPFIIFESKIALHKWEVSQHLMNSRPNSSEDVTLKDDTQIIEVCLIFY